MRRITLLPCFGCLAALLFAVYKAKCTNVIEIKPDYGPHVIGLAIGDDYLQVGVVRNNSFEIIPDTRGQTMIPAYVSFSRYGNPLAGFDADEQASDNSQNTVSNIRFSLGWNSSDSEVQLATNNFPYTVVEHGRDIRLNIHTNGEDKTISPEDVLGIKIQHLKTIAEEYLNTTITHAVIPLPYHFPAKQTQAIEHAASQGGLTAIRVRSKPVTIAIANYKYLKAYFGPLEYDKNIIIIYDGSDKVAELLLVSIDNDIFAVLGSVQIQDSAYNDFSILDVAPVCVLAPSRFVGLIEQLLSESRTSAEELGDIFISGPAIRTAEAQAFLENYFGKWSTPPMGFPYEQAVVYGAAMEGYSIIDDGNSDADFPLILTF
ncbi:hypothetical protein VTL71DRAFT_13963 [Oculimacula yallundae]|uniref:Uncharacterized protein n=1 Tax=Oculimacula yallundae TaxID=86028 RepID=A0ABR4CN50_9HELO